MTTTLNTFANAMPVYQVDGNGNIVTPATGGGASTTDPSTGTNQTSGSQKTQVVDASGNAIPFANSANQIAGNNILSALAAQFPTSLGTKPSANSLSVTLASDGPQATAANQTTGNSTLSTISGQLPATLGQKTMSNSLPVTLSSDGSYATSALQTSGNASLMTIATALASTLAISASQLPASLGAKTMANSLSIALASDGNHATAANQTNGSQTAQVYGRAWTSTPSIAANGAPTLIQVSPTGAVNIGGYGQAAQDQASSNAIFMWDQGGNIRPTATVGYYAASSGGALLQVRGDTTGAWVHAPTNAPSTSLSGTISGSGGTATVAFVSTARQEVINSSTATLWASWSASPAVNGAGSFPIAVGGSYATDRTNGTLTLLSTAASQVYTVNRFS